METIYINGNKIKETIISDLKNTIKTNSLKPKLGIIHLGDDKATEIYINHKINVAKTIGVEIELFHKKTCSQEEVEKVLLKMNQDETITGILIQLPLLSNIDKYKLFNLIDPNKDVDGFSPTNKGLMDNFQTSFMPATAKAVVHVFNLYDVELKGKEVLIIGYSDLLGMPLSKYCLYQHATVKIVHEFSKNWKQDLNKYDVIVSAVGKENLFEATMIKKGAIVIGVGVSKTDDGKVAGDFVYQDFNGIAKLVTPTPNGIGPITVASLFENVVIAAKAKDYKKII